MADIKFFTKTTVEIFPDRINRQLDTPDSPLGQRVHFIAGLLLNEARRRIGDKYSGHHTGPRIRDTGSVEHIGGASYEVIFNHPIAFLHHEGAPPHSMPLKTGRSRYYRNGPGRVTSRGDTVFATRGPISHPGSRANPYLNDAADHLGLRRSGTLLRGIRSARVFRAAK